MLGLKVYKMRLPAAMPSELISSFKDEGEWKEGRKERKLSGRKVEAIWENKQNPCFLSIFKCYTQIAQQSSTSHSYQNMTNLNTFTNFALNLLRSYES
ncbi:hypothetical protein P8452_03532 [Trifolium repens]|nr:hypothetical protein P8452_03532 [Trifolium repens]